MLFLCSFYISPWQLCYFALSFFTVKAGFYSGNLLFIGKTYFKIGNKTEAKVWIQKTLDFESESAEAKEVRKMSRISLVHPVHQEMYGLY